MFQLVKLFGLYLEHVLENLWRKEIQDDITDDKLDEIKYHYIYYPFLKSFKNFKKDIKKCGCLDDTNIKIDTNKLSNTIKEIVLICRKMIEDIIKDKLNKNITEYELYEYYEKYIDMDSFGDIIQDYELFGDEVSE